MNENVKEKTRERRKSNIFDLKQIKWKEGIGKVCLRPLKLEI
jgi:hypothetical protein